MRDAHHTRAHMQKYARAQTYSRAHTRVLSLVYILAMQVLRAQPRCHGSIPVRSQNADWNVRALVGHGGGCRSSRVVHPSWLASCLGVQPCHVILQMRTLWQNTLISVPLCPHRMSSNETLPSLDMPGALLAWFQFSRALPTWSRFYEVRVFL